MTFTGGAQTSYITPGSLGKTIISIWTMSQGLAIGHNPGALRQSSKLRMLPVPATIFTERKNKSRPAAPEAAFLRLPSSSAMPGG